MNKLNSEILEYYEYSIKRSKKALKRMKLYFICSIIFSLLYLFLIIKMIIINKDLSDTINLINFISWNLCFIIWSWGLFFSRKSIKKYKIQITKDIQNRNKILIEVDRPRYLRETRIDKLNKIEKRAI